MGKGKRGRGEEEKMGRKGKKNIEIEEKRERLIGVNERDKEKLEIGKIEE